MVNVVAKTVKFILFVAVLLFGATAIPRMFFLLFLLVTGGEIPVVVVREVLTNFIFFIIALAGFIGISSWLRRQESVFL